MVPSSQHVKFHRTVSMYCHQAITSDILTSTHANYVVLKSTHVCLLPRSRICRNVRLLHHTGNNVCYNCTRLTGMLGTHALDQCACLLYLYRTSNPAIIATGSVDIFTISMLDYIILIRHTCLKPRLQASSYICNSFTRLSGLLQYPCL